MAFPIQEISLWNFADLNMVGKCEESKGQNEHTLPNNGHREIIWQQVHRTTLCQTPKIIVNCRLASPLAHSGQTRFCFSEEENRRVH